MDIPGMYVLASKLMTRLYLSIFLLNFSRSVRFDTFAVNRNRFEEEEEERDFPRFKCNRF